MRSAWLALLVSCTSADKDDAPPDGDADTDADTDTDTDTDADADIALGSLCPLTERIGTVSISIESGSAPYLGGYIWDKPDPWISPPVQTTESCAFYAFDPGECGTCPTGMVCGVEGECVPERRTLKDARVTVRSGGTEQVFEAEDVTGLLFGEVELAEGEPFEMEIEFAGGQGSTGPLLFPSGDLDVVVTAENADSMQPGALQADWTPPADGGLVGTLVPINHHAAGPTFTTCLAPAELGTFRAEASMIDPLAVVTGLEFQGVDHVRGVAVQTEAGCVELQAHVHLYTSVTYP
jgi:hypothetical protein